MGPQGLRAQCHVGNEGTIRAAATGGCRSLHELLKTEIYKRNQGRIVRQVTCIAIWVAFALGAWQMYSYLHVRPSTPLAVNYAVPARAAVCRVCGSAIALVNLPTFADFLIAVEAEMNKVSWPSQTELIRASMVVIMLMFGLTVVLFALRRDPGLRAQNVLGVTVLASLSLVARSNRCRNACRDQSSRKARASRRPTPEQRGRPGRRLPLGRLAGRCPPTKPMPPRARCTPAEPPTTRLLEDEPSTSRGDRGRGRSLPAEPLELIDETVADEDLKFDWFILKVQVNREDSIKDALLRRVKMNGLDRYFKEIVVPTEDVVEFTKTGKRRVVKKKLYPGYILVNMSVNDESWFMVRETPGIGDFTGLGGKPTPMDPKDVERILRSSKVLPDEEGPAVKTAFRSSRATASASRKAISRISKATWTRSTRPTAA